MTYRAIIVDDMPLAIKSLQAELEDWFADTVDIVDTAGGVVEAAKKIRQSKPDIVFLDIHMNDGDGFDLLEIINAERLSVIFTTASRDHALKAFRYAAVDYLLKPIDREQIDRALSRLARPDKGEAHEDGAMIALSTQEAVQLVAFKNIIRLEAESNYTRVYLADGTFILISKTLKDLEEKLDGRFFRTHKSHLVNRAYFKAYIKSEGGYLCLTDGNQVPVSFRKRSALISLMNEMHS